MLEIRTLVVGPIQNNCYIVSDQNKRAFIVDPGGDVEEIIEACSGLDVLYILNTHGHIDHIGGNKGVKEAFPQGKLVVHKDDEKMLYDPNLNLSRLMGGAVVSPKADLVVEDNDTLPFGDKEIKIIHVPGHTPGGILIQIENFIFSGDTVFAGSIGRTDLPGGDMKTLLNSIKSKFLTLPDSHIVYPGHGEETTVKEERENNPFFQF
ncbi:MBL fold metallo-hydrolase [Anaerobranca gottschalkii]|uniref:Glyoxylase, beta-lactamase superfamily II n=1 Tax=Anaerobranca gottschalkii DSM 13577 TaxID=1120990 RepID=A0A1I0ARW4_9FIRM|nr:MBL fold metallo-hydrolase [Anaerobranca gottschalkii]SES97130.1 Glyoxylase, beta-lactamase superfamily II [Anaerobranca gottschalkii DSM 13577]